MKMKIPLLLIFLVFSQTLKSQSLEEQLAGHLHLVLAQDGSGDVKTIQEAIDKVPENSTERFVIFIVNIVFSACIVFKVGQIV